MAFAHDLCEVINVGINTELKKVEMEDEESVATTLGKMSYDDPRSRRTLGKRILKAVQAQLETALKTEAEISSKPLDTLQKELEGMLEASLEIQRPSTSATTSGADASAEDSQDVEMIDAPNEEITVAGRAANKAAEEEADDADEMEIDADGELDDDNIEVATQAKNGDPESSSSSVAGHEGNGKAAEHKPGAAPASSDTPPATNGYLAAPPPAQPAPPTPPQSIGSLGNLKSAAAADPLSEGGVALHLKDFKLRGTTILADQWPGREAIRTLSEELSDMDDRELEGLAFDVDDSTITASPNGAASEVVADTIVSKAKATSKARKKTRSSTRRR